MADDSLMVDVADALSRVEPVDWKRLSSRVSPDQATTLEHLRTLYGLTRSCADTSVDSPAALRDAQPSQATRAGLAFLLVFCGVQILGALASQLPLGDGQPREPMAPFQVAAVVTFGLAGTLLLVGSRRDYRAWLLGAVFMLIAAAFAKTFLPAQLAVAYPEAFMPAAMWAFAREFPHVERLSRVDDLAKRTTQVSVAMGAVLFLANTPPLRAAFPWLARSDTGLYWILIGGLMLGAVIALVVRSATTNGTERRRVALFVAGFAVGTAPILLDMLVELLLPFARDFGDEHRGLFAVVVFAFLLSIPFSMTYAVLARDALELRFIVRWSYRHLLDRRLLLTATGASLAALLWLLVLHSDQSLGAILADTPPRFLVSLALGTGLLALVRQPLLARLDAATYPEGRDQRRELARAGERLTQASTASQVGEVIVETAARGCGLRNASLLLADSSQSFALMPVAGPCGQLPRDSAVMFVVDSTRQPLVVDPDVARSAFHLLPAHEREWVEKGVAVVVPVLGLGAELRGLLVAGHRTDRNPFVRDDVSFLEAVAASAALALESVQTRQNDARSKQEEQPAFECPRCAALSFEAGATLCDCAVPYVEAPVPHVIAGKLLMQRRLGAGGMGVVYLARDLSLDRLVAVKTIPGASADGLLQLKQEARSMAAMMHPSVAQIYALETWRGRPFLVVEYLEGGSLAARLAHERLGIGEAVAIATALADGLAHVHASGYLHLDIKPSNIAFSGNGAPKLLDFGLAHLLEGIASPTGGTVAYMSPNVLNGGEWTPADDIWALSTVLYEMIAGTNPFLDGSPTQVADRIRGCKVPRLSDRRRDVPEVLERALREMLSVDEERRPKTALEFTAMLKQYP